jgi:hypothetical protein
VNGIEWGSETGAHSVRESNGARRLYPIQILFFYSYPIQILVNHKPPWHEGTSQSWREKRSSILFYSSYHRERERATLFWVLCCFEVEEKEGPRPWSGNKYNREKGQRQRENKGHIWQYKAKHILSLINKFNYVLLF